MKKYLVISLALIIGITLSLPIQSSLGQTSSTPEMRSDFCFKEEVYSSLSKDILDPKETKGQYYLEYSDNLDAEKIAYHRYINQRFDKVITDIGKIMKESKDKTFADIERELRGKENQYLNTGTLSVSLLCSFEKYSRFIEDNKDRFQIGPDNSLGVLDTAEQLTKASLRSDVWTEELEFSRKALDQAIATYDQISTSFLIHLKYTVIIKELDLLRRQMIKMTELISCLPSQFVNASTTQCQ